MVDLRWRGERGASQFVCIETFRDILPGPITSIPGPEGQRRFEDGANRLRVSIRGRGGGHAAVAVAGFRHQTPNPDHRICHIRIF